MESLLAVDNQFLVFVDGILLILRHTFGAIIFLALIAPVIPFVVLDVGMTLRALGDPLWDFLARFFRRTQGVEPIQVDQRMFEFANILLFIIFQVLF